MGTVDTVSRFGQLAMFICSMLSSVGRIVSSFVKCILSMTWHKFFKYSLMALASILMVASVAIIGLGIYLHMRPWVEVVYLGHSSKCLEYLCFGVGVAGVALALIGLFGGHREHRMLLILYCFMVPVLLFTPYFMGGPLALVFEGNMEMIVRRQSKEELVHLYGTPNHQDFTNAWDSAMEMFECCGVDYYKDFEGSAYQNLTRLHFPQVCLPKDSKVPFEKGCIQMMIDILEHHHKAAFIFISVLCISVSLSVVVSAIFHQLVKKKEKKEKGAFLNGEELKHLQQNIHT
uniref:tetraspanin-1-like n=1 Tax=Myxine glutinosa TaxID=7769 RepID=UPI00358FC2A0